MDVTQPTSLAPSTDTGVCRLRRWPKWASVAILALVAVVATLPGWLPGRVYVPADALKLFAPWAAPGQDYRAANEVLLDQTTQFVPWTQYTVASLRQTQMRDGQSVWTGRLPLWNPYQQLGAPLLGNGQSAVLYPTTLLHALLPPTWSWTLAAALKLLVAGLGAWLLARRAGAGESGRLLAGLAFMLCGFNVAWLNHPHTNVMVLLPWALVALLRLIERPSLVNTALAALVVGLQFVGGHPASSVHLLLTCGLVLLLQLVWLNPRQALRALPAVAVATAAGVLLAGAQLLPLLDYVDQSAAKMLRQEALAALPRWALQPWHLAGALFPYVLGYPPDRLMPFPAWGAAGVPNPNELVGGWVGTLPLLLAGLAIVWRRDRRTWLWLIVMALALAIAVRLPGVDHLVRRVPGLQVAQNGRLMAAVALALSMLAGIGMEATLQRIGVDGAPPLRRFVRWAGLTLAGLAVLSFVILLLARPAITRAIGQRIHAVYADGGDHEHTPQYWVASPGRMHTEMLLTSARLLIPAAMMGCVLGLLWWRSIRPTCPNVRSAWPWIVFVAAELLVFAVPYNRGASAALYHPSTGPTQWLRCQQVADAPRSYRIAGTFRTLHPEWATSYGLRDVRGYDALSHQRTWRLMQAIDPQETSLRQADLIRLEELEHPALKLLGLRYLMVGPKHPAPPAPWRQVYPTTQSADPRARIYEHPQAMPRAWVAQTPVWYDTAEQVIQRVAAASHIGRQPSAPRSSTHASTHAATQAAMRSDAVAATNPADFDPQRVVLLDRQMPQRTAEMLERMAYLQRRSGWGSGSVRILEDEPHRVKLEVEGRGWLVLADAFDEGWVARVGQGTVGSEFYREQEYPVVPAYGALRAVPLPAVGRCRVIFEYRPAAWRNGLLASAAGGVIVLMLLGLAMLKSREGDP